MSELSFDELNTQIAQHFRDQTYAQGLMLVEKYRERFSEHLAHLNYFGMCLAARLGDKPKVIALLGETLRHGIWFSENTLHESPSLLPLLGDPEYEKLVALSVEMQRKDFGTGKSLMVVHPRGSCGRDTATCPALIALHSNGEMPQDTLAGWGIAAQDGWLVGVPISSKTLWAGSGHFWLDHENAADEVMTQFANLEMGYNLDPERLVLGGFSMGGEVALWMALKGILAVRGFILLGPGGPLLDDPDEWLPLIQESKDLGLRGYVIFGEEDRSIPQDGIRKTVAKLNEHDIPTLLEVRNGLAHEYPPEFIRVLEDAFRFIFEGEV